MSLGIRLNKIKYETFDQLSDLPIRYRRPVTVSSVQFRAAMALLWFATRNGVEESTPENFKESAWSPVSIRSLSADGKAYVFDSSASLPALTKDLRVEYTALSLSIPERVRFRYKLDGWDQDWRDVRRA